MSGKLSCTATPAAYQTHIRTAKKKNPYAPSTLNAYRHPIPSNPKYRNVLSSSSPDPIVAARIRLMCHRTKYFFSSRS